jgi:hypothetical protein
MAKYKKYTFTIHMVNWFFRNERSKIIHFHLNMMLFKIKRKYFKFSIKCRFVFTSSERLLFIKKNNKTVFLFIFSYFCRWWYAYLNDCWCLLQEKNAAVTLFPMQTIPWVCFMKFEKINSKRTYLLMWHCNQYLVKACWRRFLHVCLSWAQCVQSLMPRARLSLFNPSVHLDFGLPWFLLPMGLALNRALCGRSSGLLIMWPA